MEGFKDVRLEQMLPLMNEQFANGGSVRFTAHGSSMLPMMRDAEVFLEAAPARLKRGDVPMYRRADGSFVLHRVVRVHPDGSYGLCGDHQTVVETVRPEQILARMSAYCRPDGSVCPVTNPGYLHYVRRRMASRPLRRVYWGLRHRIGTLWHSVFSKG